MKTDKILKLIQQKNAMRSGGALPLPKAQKGWQSGAVSPQDSVRNMAGNTMTWEFNRGSAGGTGLPNYGNPALPYGATKEDAVNWYMQNIYPKLEDYSTAMEKASAGDFLYNSGKDLRGYAIQEYLKKKDPSNKTGWQDASGNYKYRKDPTQWDVSWKEMQNLPVNDRRVLLNKGRDWYYQHTNTNPDNTPNDAYWNTWYGRQHATDQYIPLTDRDVTNPSDKKFYPTRQQFGGLSKAQEGLQYVATPGSTYGNYYDPSTGEYIPQVYLKDVDIVADKELPFQNGKFAPFLASRGVADYVPVEAALLPATPAIKGLGKVGNFALDALNPLSGMRGLKSAPKANLLDDVSPDEFSTRGLVKELQNEGVLPNTFTAKQAETFEKYPNLLDLAVKRGIKDRLTVKRTVSPGTEAISSSGTATEFSPEDLALMEKYGVDDPTSQAFWMGTRIPSQYYGQRTGGYDIDFGKHDALYHFNQFDPEGKPLFAGVDSQYGTHTVTARYPFDYSGSTGEVLDRYRLFMKRNSYENQKLRDRKLYEESQKRNRQSKLNPGEIRSYNNEAFIVGEHGAKVLEPVKVTTNSYQKNKVDKLLNEFDEWNKVAVQYNKGLISKDDYLKWAENVTGNKIKLGKDPESSIRASLNKYFDQWMETRRAMKFSPEFSQSEYFSPLKYKFRPGGLIKAQEGLQYVPNGTYGNYYDPNTQQYIPQVYLPDVEISASKDLPYQNGQFAPWLVAQGTADYVPIESMLLPATPAIKGLSKAANFAIDALNPLSGMRGLRRASVNPEKNINTQTELSRLVREIQEKYQGNPANAPELNLTAINRFIKNLQKFEDVATRVPGGFLSEAKGFAAKERQLGKKDFWTDKELDELVDLTKKYNEASDEFADEVSDVLSSSPNTSFEDMLDMYPNLRYRLESLQDNRPIDFRTFFLTPQQEKRMNKLYGDDARNPLSRFNLDRVARGLFNPPTPDWMRDMAKEYGKDLDYINYSGVREGLPNTTEGLFTEPSAVKNLRVFKPGQMNQMGGLTKHQSKGVVMNPFTNTPVATGAAESTMGPIEMLLLPSQLPIRAASALGRGLVLAAEALNPISGLKPTPGMMYRGIGKEGFEDAMKSGVLRPQQHGYPSGRSIKEILSSPKQFGSTYFTPHLDIAKKYGKTHVAVTPKTEEFLRRYGRKDWSWSIGRQLPLNEVELYKKNLMGAWRPVKKDGGLTASKAREILHDKSVHGQPLTDKQRRFFGAVASGQKIRIKKTR